MRAENGHPDPYDVKIWGLGNTDENVWWNDFNNPDSYAQSYMKFRTVLREMREEMTLIGLGLSKRHYMPGWVESCLDYITRNGTSDEPDLLSVHYYLGGCYRVCLKQMEKNALKRLLFM